MDRNGIAVDRIRAYVELMRTTPQAGAVTGRSRHRWARGNSVDWHAEKIVVGGQPIGRDHRLRLDMPSELGGSDGGPTPGELLAAALGACIAQRFVEEAALRDVDVDGLEVGCEGDFDMRGIYQLDGVPPGSTGMRVTLSVRSPADDAVLDELLQTAVATSPVAGSMAGPVPVRPAVQRSA